MIDIDFPIEFLVQGTPVSHQSASAKSKQQWQQRVKTASATALPEQHIVGDRAIAATLYYFPSGEMLGDVDNIVKLTLDALNKHVYFDDRQIERIVAQKFETNRVFVFSNPSEILKMALTMQPPILYVKISDDPHEDLS